MKAWVALAVAFYACALGVRAQADTPNEREKARVLFAAGLEHADAGRDAEALAAFKRAYDVEPHFAVLYNIAQIELRLGDEQAAYETLRRYLAIGDVDTIPPERRLWAERTIESLSEVVNQKVASQQHDPVADAVLELVKLDVICPWFDFVVSVDSAPMAQSPFAGSFWLPAGAHQVRFLRDGYVSNVFRIELSREKAAKVTCRPTPLDPLPPALRTQLELNLEPPSAAALLNGLPIESGAYIPAGRHLLLVKAPDHTPKRLKIVLSSGVHRTISIRLHPLRNEINSSTTARQAAETHSTIVEQHPYRRAGALLGAAGLATAASGVAIFIWNDQRYREWKRENHELRASGASAEADYENRVSQHNELLDSIHRYDEVTWIAAGTGGLLTVAAGVMFFWREPQNSNNLVFVPGGAGYRVIW